MFVPGATSVLTVALYRRPGRTGGMSQPAPPAASEEYHTRMILFIGHNACHITGPSTRKQLTRKPARISRTKRLKKKISAFCSRCLRVKKDVLLPVTDLGPRHHSLCTTAVVLLVGKMSSRGTKTRKRNTRKGAFARALDRKVSQGPPFMASCERPDSVPGTYFWGTYCSKQDQICLVKICYYRGP